MKGPTQACINENERLRSSKRGCWSLCQPCIICTVKTAQFDTCVTRTSASSALPLPCLPAANQHACPLKHTCEDKRAGGCRGIPDQTSFVQRQQLQLGTCKTTPFTTRSFTCPCLYRKPIAPLLPPSIPVKTKEPEAAEESQCCSAWRTYVGKVWNKDSIKVLTNGHTGLALGAAAPGAPCMGAGSGRHGRTTEE